MFCYRDYQLTTTCHKELKDGKYSKNVQNCPNSDMFGFNVKDDQNSQHNVQENRIHNENNVIYDFPANYTTKTTTLANYCLCTCFAIKLIYQDHSVSYSKNQSTIITLLLL